jgi:co-chaperonin GroES (HSP10)
MKPIEGTLRPLDNKVLVYEMEFGIEKSQGGIFLPSDDGKSAGIHPRWAKVYAIGPNQQDVKVGEWILLEHGRWSRGINYRTPEGDDIVIRLADLNAMLMSADEKPSGAQRNEAIGAGSNFNFNIPG